jgi:mono/diheme cytochrome c family protein
MRSVLVLAAFAFPALAQAQGAVSIERGLQVSIVGGCHDCHTNGYDVSGQVDPEKALKGTSLGWRGPWGTTYPRNLRLLAASHDEDGFLNHLKTFKARPPMPWFNVHAMDESDIRSLYQYIKSLGEPGEQVPEALPPGEEPKTPFIVVAPPTMPQGG